MARLIRRHPAAQRMTIGWDDFLKVDMRVGRVIEVAESTAKKPSYKIRVDLGPLGVKTSSVGVRPWYTPDEMMGRLVVCVVNFPPRQVGPVLSEVLTMGAVEADGRVVLLQPDRDAELGARVA